VAASAVTSITAVTSLSVIAGTGAVIRQSFVGPVAAPLVATAVRQTATSASAPTDTAIRRRENRDLL